MSYSEKIISIAIYSIWGILIIFGVLTIIQPGWLVRISDPGKDVEARAISNIGDNHLKDKQYSLAISNYIKALKIVPDLKHAIANLGIAYQQSGQFSKAIIVFDQLLQMDPEYPDIVYFQLANIYEKTGKPQDAVKYYLLSAEASADPQNAYQKAGHIYMDNNDFDNAIDCFHKAIDSKNDISNAYKSMLIVKKQSLADTTELYNLITRELEDRSYVDFLSDYDESIFNTILAKDINLAKTYNNLGYCLAMQKNYDDAKQYIKIAVQIYPSYRDAINNLIAIDKLIEENK